MPGITLRPSRPVPARRSLRWAAVAAAATLGLAACGNGAASTAPSAGVDATDWRSVVTAADGQTVNWYMWGGDSTLNDFVNGYLSDQLAKQGVTLNQVPIDDTVQAIDTVLGETQAGRDEGSVDLVWVNGENFATGKQADLWWCHWPSQLPSASFVDFTDDAVTHDFGAPVEDCEAAWQRADSALVYRSDRIRAADVASISALFDWAAAHPGRFTYPAPPDFTGSMAVRTILYDTIGGPDSLLGVFDEDKYASAAPQLWRRLDDLRPSLWRQGTTYPQSQAQVEQMYADGEIDAYFTYGPGAIGDKVAKGIYPAATREAVPSVGNIGNVSFVAIPKNAAHPAAALVLANLLQDPQTQLELYRATGAYPAVDLDKVPPAVRADFAAVPSSEAVLPLDELSARGQPELASDYVTRLERDWKTEVLQR
ncbi:MULTISPECIES: ABC transporter substrate-binding protein [unclassified Nocardioides]|uniref:ABC transporter substrate-binding protein n=1 Tax=unclassified Nocardioides TaxID=2615069 RepID=UPI0000570138|nr:MULTISPECIES: ABC transporter substrate-binding protein [unclassified Nocardioides]ABL81577.1 putative secreted protein [Nocardioides sp. JS614]